MLEKDLVGGPQLAGRRTKKVKKQWRESKRALKGLDLDEVTARVGYATRVLAAWAQSAHLLNSTAGKIRQEEDEKKLQQEQQQQAEEDAGSERDEGEGEGEGEGEAEN